MNKKTILTDVADDCTNDTCRDLILAKVEGLKTALVMAEVCFGTYSNGKYSRSKMRIIINVEEARHGARRNVRVRNCGVEIYIAIVEAFQNGGAAARL